jgi:tetratricopeptide (TPR) repeat protein
VVTELRSTPLIARIADSVLLSAVFPLRRLPLVIRRGLRRPTSGIFLLVLPLLFVPALLAQCQPDIRDVRQAPQTQNPSQEQPQFFDQPSFTVADVTDAANPAGHGSTGWRTSDALVKQTASLGRSNSTSANSSPPENEQSLRDAAHQPDSFEANHLLGNMLLAEHKPREALPYLEKAAQLKSGDYENNYELARAYANSGDYPHSQATARQLLAQRDTAEVHHLLADNEEKLGDPLAAVRDYQRAAELAPSESNLFDWGAELLLHHAPEPASEVFAKGNRLFPTSARMLIGLAISWYARGSNEQAAACLCQASDLNPSDPNPYLFLGRLQDEQLTSSAGVLERFKRFAELQPENAMANYYYAVALWKQPKASDSNASATVQSLLQKAISLNPKFGLAYLQLGIVYSEQKEFANTISAYKDAVQADPTLEAAHYRLAQIYRQTGEKQNAKRELQLYQQLSKMQSDQAHQQRRGLQQFVYTLRDQAPPASQQ